MFGVLDVVVGIFPDQASAIRLVGTTLADRRYLSEDPRTSLTLSAIQTPASAMCESQLALTAMEALT